MCPQGAPSVLIGIRTKSEPHNENAVVVLACRPSHRGTSPGQGCASLVESVYYTLVLV